jgi:hypothetical protein
MAGSSSTTPHFVPKALSFMGKSEISTNFRLEKGVKAFVVDKYKKKGTLLLVNRPEPKLQDDDVLIRIHATAVNLPDSKARDGEFKLLLPYRPLFILGHDVAGTVVKTGPKVRQFKILSPCKLFPFSVRCPERIFLFYSDEDENGFQ